MTCSNCAQYNYWKIKTINNVQHFVCTCGHLYGDYFKPRKKRKVKTQGKVLILGLILLAWFFISLVCVTLS